MNRKRIDIHFIAEKAGVSYTTVSRVMNNSSLVKPTTRRKVEALIRKHDYVPDYFARGLKRKRSYTIGLIVTNITYPFYPRIIRHIEEQAFNNGFSVILCDSGGDLEREKLEIGVLLEKKVDGIIAAPVDVPDSNEDLYRRIVASGKSVVFVNNFLEDVDTDSVRLDNIEASQRITEHLIRIGHKRLGLIKDAFDRLASREDGFRRAHEKHGMTIDPDLLVRRDISEGGIRTGLGDELDGHRFAKVLLSRSEPPTAIFASNDAMALGVCKYAHDSGIPIPDELAVVGFDDVPYASFLNVPLTTMAQPSQEIAGAAFGLLRERIESDSEILPRTVMVKAKLIVRESCGATRARSVSSA